MEKASVGSWALTCASALVVEEGSALLWRAELLDWLKAEGSLNLLLARCPSPGQPDHCDGELDCDYSKPKCLDQ